MFRRRTANGGEETRQYQLKMTSAMQDRQADQHCERAKEGCAYKVYQRDKEGADDGPDPEVVAANTVEANRSDHDDDTGACV